MRVIQTHCSQDRVLLTCNLLRGRHHRALPICPPTAPGPQEEPCLADLLAQQWVSLTWQAGQHLENTCSPTSNCSGFGGL